MIFGTRVHQSILEDVQFFALKNKDKRTKLYQEELSDFLEHYSKEQLVSDEELEKINAVKAAVYSHECAFKLLSDTETEVELITDTYKCKIDAIGKDYLIDLKTSDSCSMEDFERSSVTYNYYFQAAFYLKLANELAGSNMYNSFYFIVAEKNAPHDIAVFKLTEEALAYGNTLVNKAMRLYSTYLTIKDNSKILGRYPDNKAVELNVPKWAPQY